MKTWFAEAGVEEHEWAGHLWDKLEQRLCAKNSGPASMSEWSHHHSHAPKEE